MRVFLNAIARFPQEFGQHFGEACNFPLAFLFGASGTPKTSIPNPEGPWHNLSVTGRRGGRTSELFPVTSVSKHVNEDC